MCVCVRESARDSEKEGETRDAKKEKLQKSSKESREIGNIADFVGFLTRLFLAKF